MTTKLEKPIKREILIDGQPHTVTVQPNGIKLVPKGCRNGTEMSWKDLKDAGIQN
jgi:hypothetical protein